MRRNGSLGFINPLGPNQTTPCGADGRGLYGQDACPARFGNFYLEVFANETATGPGFRSFHLDSTVSGPGQNGSIIPVRVRCGMVCFVCKCHLQPYDARDVINDV